MITIVCVYGTCMLCVCFFNPCTLELRCLELCLRKVFRNVPLTGVYNCVLFRTVSVKGALCGLLALICVMW